MECVGQAIPEDKLSFGLAECTQEILSNQSEDKPQKRKKLMKKNQMVRLIFLFCVNILMTMNSHVFQCIKLCQRKKQGIVSTFIKVNHTCHLYELTLTTFSFSLQLQLDSNGRFSEAGSNQFVENAFPAQARSRIQRGLTRCDHGK